MTDLSILNLLEVHGRGWEVRSDISEGELRWMQHLMSRCVPVLSDHPDFLNDWCVEWTGALDPDGYARHKPPKDLDGSKLVHRWMYEKAIEPLGNLTVDHACGNRGCCNLRHLRALPLKLNRQLGDHRQLYSVQSHRNRLLELQVNLSH